MFAKTDNKSINVYGEMLLLAVNTKTIGRYEFGVIKSNMLSKMNTDIFSLCSNYSKFLFRWFLIYSLLRFFFWAVFPLFIYTGQVGEIKKSDKRNTRKFCYRPFVAMWMKINLTINKSDNFWIYKHSFKGF